VATAAAAALAASLVPATQSAAAHRPGPGQRDLATASGTTARLAPNAFEKRVLKQVNKRRDAKGLRKVGGNGCLDDFAESWAEQIATTGLMEHQSMTVILTACDLTWAGETLARGSSMTPGKTVKAWMKSPTHRAVIMKRRANRVGIGVRYDSDDRAVVVLDAGDVN
jgi:uncharacterized protein YkwD